MLEEIAFNRDNDISGTVPDETLEKLSEILVKN